MLISDISVIFHIVVYISFTWVSSSSWGTKLVGWQTVWRTKSIHFQILQGERYHICTCVYLFLL